MRYLVKARVKAEQQKPLLQAIRDKTLGQGSVAGDEYVYDMEQARVDADGTAHWIETCFCPTALQEERPYWEEFFDLLGVKDAHNRKNCRDWNGTEAWACCNCDCTRRLEQRLQQHGESFLQQLIALSRAHLDHAAPMHDSDRAGAGSRSDKYARAESCAPVSSAPSSPTQT